VTLRRFRVCLQGFPHIVATTVKGRYRLDDLRRLATALGSASGLPRATAQALSSHLLWFDAVGAANLGISSLPGWLDAIEAGRIDPRVDGFVRLERAALAVLDGKKGLPLIVLDRAGALAEEKARDVGAAWVRVTNIDATVSAAPVVAGIATGPFICIVVGPGGLLSVALPAPDGLPVIFDTALFANPTPGGKNGKAAQRGEPRRRLTPSLPAPIAQLATWAEVVAPNGDWLIGAVAVAELEPLATFHERVRTALSHSNVVRGQLAPSVWEARRREARERGIPIAAPVWKKLSRWGERLRVELPEPAAAAEHG
jgi:LDH2 family malate/lactate/ureidoglycolate dehydrogenase